MRRAATGSNPAKQTGRILYHVAQFYGTMVYENVHPLQGGYFRRKVRTQRRYGLALENPLVFYPRRVWEILRTYCPLPLFVWKLARIRSRILRDPAKANYSDAALSADAADAELQWFSVEEPDRLKQTATGADGNIDIKPAA